MTAKGYTTQALVVNELGRALTSGEAAEFSGLLEEIEVEVDGQTGRAWLVASPIVETHAITGRYLFLQQRPIASITSVTVRPPWPNGAAAVLADYEMLDATTGTLLLGSGHLGLLATVTYTTAPAPGPAVPADIREAATLLLADRFTSRANATTAASVAAGLTGYRIGPDLEMRFSTGSASSRSGSTGGSTSPRAARAAAILARYAPTFAFA